jgi:hypothetical protein
MENIVQIRLECLKLAHRADLLPNEVVNRSMEYEQYVVGELQVPDNQHPRRPGRPAGKTAQR